VVKAADKDFRVIRPARIKEERGDIGGEKVFIALPFKKNFNYDNI